MKNLIRTVAFFAMMGGLTAAAQQQKSEFPEIVRFTQMFNLNEEQVMALDEFYNDQMAQGAEVDARSKDLQITRKKASEGLSEEELVEWKNQMDDVARQRNKMQMDKETFIRELLDENQLERYEAWKRGSKVNEKGMMEEQTVPTRSGQTKVIRKG